MDRWAGALYGDPCRECAFSFSTGLNAALTYLAQAPAAYRDLVGEADGTERHPDLSWSVGAYVCHVADNLRIWAERLAGAAEGFNNVAPYDQDLLARSRSYRDIPLAAALWSLERGRSDLAVAVSSLPTEGIVLIHRERGKMHLEDVARGAAHDTFHHAWDIAERSPAPVDEWSSALTPDEARRYCCESASPRSVRSQDGLNRRAAGSSPLGTSVSVAGRFVLGGRPR